MAEGKEIKLSDLPKEIVVNKRERLQMEELNNVRSLLKQKSGVTSKVYTRTMAMAKKLLTTSMEIDAQTDKNSKGWRELLARLSKKYGVDFVKYNYQMNYKEGKFIAPTPEQQAEADEARAMAAEQAKVDGSELESEV